MAYREAAPEETRRFSALFVPWRGLASALVIGAGAAVPLAVVGVGSVALSLPLALFALTLAWQTGREVTRVTIEVTRSEIRARVGHEEQRFALSELVSVQVMASPADGVFGLLPGPRLRDRRVLVATRDGRHEVLVRPVVAGKRLDAFVATAAGTVDLAVVASDVQETPVDAGKRAWVGFLHAVAVVSSVGFGAEALANRHTGELVITCEERCAFQGMECLPGGEVSMRLDPGLVTVELGEPGTRRALVVEVREGHRTELVCRADATTPTPHPEAP
ncbi:MAG: hypothetical protein H6723_02690 [Sandaracinus sp.]|nr:hypothetical protein [Sandaracinus sp.]